MSKPVYCRSANEEDGAAQVEVFSEMSKGNYRGIAPIAFRCLGDNAANQAGSVALAPGYAFDWSGYLRGRSRWEA